MAQSAEHWISKLGLVEHPGEEDGEADFKVKRMSSTFGILRVATVYRERIRGMKRKNLFFEADCKSQRTAKAPNT